MVCSSVDGRSAMAPFYLLVISLIIWKRSYREPIDPLLTQMAWSTLSYSSSTCRLDRSHQLINYRYHFHTRTGRVDRSLGPSQCPCVRPSVILCRSNDGSIITYPHRRNLTEHLIHSAQWNGTWNVLVCVRRRPTTARCLRRMPRSIFGDTCGNNRDQHIFMAHRLACGGYFGQTDTYRQLP